MISDNSDNLPKTENLFVPEVASHIISRESSATMGCVTGVWISAVTQEHN